MESHQHRLAPIVDKVTAFYKTSTPFRIYKGGTNSTRPSSKTHANTVDISSLNHVISIDPVTKTCLVEPNVTMQDLIIATMKHNLIPPVVPEFLHITVGGAFAGTAGESSSFRHGLFDSCVVWFEMVLGDGEIVMASSTEHQDLFQGARGAFGTLGISTMFQLQLVEAKRYVQLAYIFCKSIEEARFQVAVESMKPAGQVDFIDGIMFAKDAGLVMSGKMVDEAEHSPDVRKPLVERRFTRARDPWFYLRAKQVMTKRSSSKYHQAEQKQQDTTDPVMLAYDLIPLYDYLFRYDRGCFWSGRIAFKYFMTPFNRITRGVLSRFMSSKTMYAGLHRSGLIQQYVVQDTSIPNRSVVDFAHWAYQNLDIWPLWFVPLKLSDGDLQTSINPTYLATEPDNDHNGGPTHISFGIWGLPSGDSYTANRQLEAKLKDIHGYKCLYAQTFYTEDEFWGTDGIYNKQYYVEMRTKYKATTLPDLYTKVGGTAANQFDRNTGIWRYRPLAGLRGVVSVLKRSDYLRRN